MWACWFLLGISRAAIASNCGSSITGFCTIASSGYYIVSSNYTATTDGIDIGSTVGTVTINLNGHTITGGTGVGINGNGASNTKIAVIGPGVITGFGGAGISLGDKAAVVNVEVLSNGAGGSSGISVGAGATIAHCIANSNGSTTSNDGIACGSNCSVVWSVANGNTGDGIATGNNSAVLGNSANQNNVYGLDATNTRFGRNVFRNNASNCVNFTGTSMLNNVCNASTL